MRALAFAVGCALAVPAVAGCSDSSPSAMDAGVSVDLAPVGSGDSVPAGAIAFFNTLACPAGWSPYAPANGRFLVPTPPGSGTDGGAAVGEALAPAEIRAHGHAIAESVTLTDTSFVGIAGCCNNGPSGAGAAGFSTMSEPASTGLPYVQLLACRKSAAAEAAASPLPIGLMVFSDGDACPAGFSQNASTGGRHLVGLPDGGTPGATFGGPPLARGEDRVHGHGVSGALTTTASGIALASGCCGGGYASNGSYPFSAPSAGASTGLPYLNLLHCTKN